MSTTYKNSTSCLNSFVGHCSLKNPVFWLVFLDHKSRTRFFSNVWFLKKVKRPLVLSYSSKKVQMNGLDFCQNPKNLIFGPFLGLFGPSWPDGTFSSKSGLVTFLTLWLSNFMQKIRKKLISIFWHLGLRTDGQKDGTKFIGHFRSQGCPKNATWKRMSEKQSSNFINLPTFPAIFTELVTTLALACR